MYAIRSYYAHWDGYPHRPKNYLLYDNPKDGRWQFIPWDLDATFQSIGHPINTEGSVFYYLDHREPYSNAYNEPLDRPLPWRLMKIKRFRDQYIYEYHRITSYNVCYTKLLRIGGITLIKTSGNVVDDIPKHDIIYQDLLFFEQQYVGVLPFEIAIDTKEPNGVFKNSASTLYKMKKLENVLTRDSLYTRNNFV